MRKIKGFAYDTEKDADVIEHIDNQPLSNNQYVWGLVRRDMASEDDIECTIIKCIEKYLENHDMQKINNNECDIDKNEIMNILNLK